MSDMLIANEILSLMAGATISYPDTEVFTLHPTDRVLLETHLKHGGILAGYINRYLSFEIKSHDRTYSNILAGSVDTTNVTLLVFETDTDLNDSIQTLGSNNTRIYEYFGTIGKFRRRVIIPYNQITSIEIILVKPIFTVLFNSNEGSDVVGQNINYDTLARLPIAPTKPGYTFVNWYKEASCTNIWDFDADTVTAATTIYAEWTTNSYTVTFNINGGSATGSQSIPYNTVATLPAAPTKTGYTFGGWYKEIGLVNLWSFGTNVVTGATTIYAKWTINVSVTFNSNGGSVVASQVIDCNTVATLPTPPTKTGYTFGGWYKEVSLINIWSFGINRIISATTIYAKWNVISYTVTFDSGTDGSAVTSQSIDYNTVATLPTPPTKTGYTFDAWYSDAGLTTAWTFASDLITAAATIYAKWTIISYTVTFDSGTDGSAVTSQSIDYNTVATLPTDPTRTGYTFDAWYSDVDCTILWIFASDVVTAATTIYAKWTII